MNKLQDIIQILIDHGGRLSNVRLKETLELNEVDYTRERDEAINLGVIKIGRGRGGSVMLVKEEHLKAAAEVAEILLEEERSSKKSRRKNTQDNTDNDIPKVPLTDEEYSMEWQKANYEPVPADLSEFKPGMYVVRPPTYLFSELEAWRNLRHYVVTHTDDKSVYVRNRYNTFAETIPTKPEGFYKPVRR